MLAWLILVAAAWWALLARTLAAVRRIERLDDLPALPAGDLPRLSVVVAASNEEEALPASLRSLQAQDYPDLEILLVNDRSTDSTGAIMRRHAEGDPRVRVLEVESLPPGWLGKTHAQNLGGREASGALLLFTDADVVFEPGALSRAAGALLGRGADHLALGPRIDARGFWENVFVSLFALAFMTRFEIDRASDPDHPAAVGIGAFNLVRADAWRSVGGHEPLALQVVDDLALALTLKRAGFRTMYLEGARWVRVRWVAGLGGILRGLEKNAYAGVDYSFTQAHTAALGLVVLTAAPLAAPAGGGGLVPAAAAALVGMAACGALAARGIGVALWAGLFYPLAGPVLALAILRSAWLAEIRGAIVWRGTRYPLADLRARRIRL